MSSPEQLLRRAERERAARKQAEQLLEQKSLELYELNQRLQAQTIELEGLVRERTDELERTLRMAEEALRTKGEFLAVVSHEIRTPMNGVIGMVELLRMTTLTEEQHNYISTIRSSGELLLALINDILDFSKLESGKLELEQRSFDVRMLVRDITSLYAGQARAKNLQLLAEVQDGVPVWLMGDSIRLKQVLTNLISNALKFTHRGEVRLHVRSEGEKLNFGVQDSGIGIPAERQDRLFEIFSQVDSSISRKYGGTGLGLAICKRLVTAMGGEFTVDSVPGQGSTFSFCLPLIIGQEVDFSATQPIYLPKQASRMKILLVEDNPVNQMLALKLLEKLGHPADLARDGLEAVARVRTQTYELVLMDMQMPNMDGLTATREIRRLTDIRQPRIVALTANAMESDREQCLAAGMDDFLSKPFRAVDLQSVLERSQKKAA